MVAEWKPRRLLDIATGTGDLALAVERALRAAQGDESDEQIAEPAVEKKPTAAADHDDSEEFAAIMPLDDAEDDTI